jgi:hypothetical protein
MTESTALTTTSDSGSLTYLTDAAAFDHIWRVSKAFSASKMVPTQFQGKAEDCFVACQMALQLGVNPLLALQNLTVIQGRPGFNAQFAIALANQRGPFLGPITYSTTGKGETLAVTAKAVIKATGEEVSITVDMATAKAEGWSTRNSKYKSIPEQMLRYRAATWLIRLYCPEVLMGFQTSEEIIDTSTTQRTTVRDVTPEEPRKGGLEALNQQIKAAPEPEEVEVVATGSNDDHSDNDDLF